MYFFIAVDSMYFFSANKYCKEVTKFFHRLLKAENALDFFGEAILFCLFFLQFQDFSSSQTLAHGFEMCCTHCTHCFDYHGLCSKQ